MPTLRVRLYNVLFGDAILVSVPDRDGKDPRTRHVLIDVGNRSSGAGSDDAVFAAAYEDILRVLDGAPLDLYVMTHEHMDHIQGLPLLAANGHDVKADLRPRHVWLTASAHPKYYETHHGAEKEKKKMEAAWHRIAACLAASGSDSAPAVRTLLDLNDPFKTQECVAFLRTLAPKSRTHFIHRGTNLAGKHDFRIAKLRVWAPEKNTSIYYGRFTPFAVAEGDGSEAEGRASPQPPQGVDAGAFYNLVAQREGGAIETLLRIDKAANDTSLVFSLSWRGWNLLFTGDAEERSWKEMNKRGVLKPVHFLKVGHHLSQNGTPDGEILEKLLPVAAPDRKKRYAGVSTCLDAYTGVPHLETRNDLAKRATVLSTHELPKGELFVEFAFRARA